MTGVVAGFPPAAEAACSGSREIGLFRVTMDKGGALVRHNKRFGKYALDAYLTKGQDVRIDIYYYDALKKKPYDAIMYFDDRTEFKLPVKVDHVDAKSDPKFSVFAGWVDADSPLVKLFKAARDVEITINERNSRRVAFATSPKITLDGSSKAVGYAVQGIRDCQVQQGGGTSNAAPPGCFLTTACVDMLGLDDDCYELTVLRGFRDEDMANDAEGRAMAEVYRDLAPEILAALPGEQRDRILRALYGRYILPSVFAVRLGMKGLARRIYVKGMITLMQRYTPDLLADWREQLVALFGDRAVRALAR